MSEPDIEFLVTKEYRRFAEFCAACHRYRYIGLCYGPAGVGKTLSARHYARWDALKPYLEDGLRDGSVLPQEIGGCRTVVYTPEVATSPRKIAREVRLLRNGLNWAVERALRAEEGPDFSRIPPERTELLIADEADRLKMTGVEQLRDIYDRGSMGLILIGMPGLEKRLARYPQLYSRVGFVHQYRLLGDEEMRFILEHKWERLALKLDPTDYTDAEAMAAITRITGGNFRLLQRLFTQVERVLEINHLRTITKEVVETARENLVIGPLG